jgi:hypothetical protein
MFRGISGPEANESDFESYARDPARKAIGRKATFENVVSFFGVSVYSSVEALLDTHQSEWIAEVDPDKARGVLSIKTRRDPSHHDLLGDRRDMVEGVVRVIKST